jgi:hypothetical protein
VSSELFVNGSVVLYLELVLAGTVFTPLLEDSADDAE